MSYQLVWLRTDLRVADNPALYKAMSQGPTLALYLVTPEQWKVHQDSPNKLEFWRLSLIRLAEQLQQLKVPLLVRCVPRWVDVAEHLIQLCQQYSIQTLHFNDEYGVNEQRRDQDVQQRLSALGIGCHSYLDQVFFAPGTLLTQTGRAIQVYSAFRKQCHARLLHHLPKPLPRPKAQQPVGILPDQIPERFSEVEAISLSDWPMGESAAHSLLELFVSEHLAQYAKARDFPAQTGTSRLSPYLTAGVLSVRQCVQAALSLTHGHFDTQHSGFITWVDELLWREFYRHILHAYPRLSRGYAFKPETEALLWRQAPEDLAAWQQGRTGFPIVDAAMRCLKATGWMHNRLRMIVAMFLSKNLLIDWRVGEQWFMQHLLDGDLAQNNGGWQWSASTGTDAVPYFRLFNPITQSEKFDPQGDFIRRWVPELAHVSAQKIHNPATLGGLFGISGYPRPILDLAQSRKRALQAFKSLSSHQTEPS